MRKERKPRGENDRYDAGFLKAIADRVCGKTAVVALAREALFLSGRDDVAVAHDRRRAVMVEGGYAERDQAARSEACSTNIIRKSCR
jgi:hypothetical protein